VVYTYILYTAQAEKAEMWKPVCAGADGRIPNIGCIIPVIFRDAVLGGFCKTVLNFDCIYRWVVIYDQKYS